MSEQNTASVGLRLGLAGVLEYRDASGEVIKRVPFTGSIPVALDDEGQLTSVQEKDHGTHDRR